MSAKSVAAGLLGSALLATVAFAQTPTTTGDRTNMAPAGIHFSGSCSGFFEA